jgi:hypothetical protein
MARRDLLNDESIRSRVCSDRIWMRAAFGRQADVRARRTGASVRICLLRHAKLLGHKSYQLLWRATKGCKRNTRMAKQRHLHGDP